MKKVLLISSKVRLGDDIVTGGDFESGLGSTTTIEGSGSASTWTVNTTNPISGSQDGLWNITNGVNGRPILDLRNIVGAFTNGKTYRVEFDYKVNSGTFTIKDYYFVGTFNTINLSLTGSGKYSVDVEAGRDGVISFWLYIGYDECSVQIDNVSIKEVL